MPLETSIDKQLLENWSSVATIQIYSIAMEPVVR